MSKICILCGREYDDDQPNCPYCQNKIEEATQKRKFKLNLNFGLAFSAESKSKKFIIIGAIALVVAIIVIVSIFVFARNIGHPRKSGTYAANYEDFEYLCPDFLGMTVSEVEQHEYYKDNILEFKFEYIENDQYDINQVCDQSIHPNETKTIQKGSEIILYVSIGNATVTVPDVFNMDESEAVNTLKAQGFTVTIQNQKSEEVEAGRVIKTDLAFGSKVPAKSRITVYVSSGMPEKYVQVPNVVGYSMDDAINNLTSVGLMYEIVERDLTADEKYFDQGYIISQTPEKNEEVLQGTIVTLYVSTGVSDFRHTPVVTIPQELSEFEGYVSIWKDGIKVDESEKISLNKRKYVFEELISNEKTVNYTAKVRFDGPDSYTYYCFSDIMFNTKENIIENENSLFDYEDALIPVPDVIEMDEVSARTNLEDVGLTVKTVFVVDSSSTNETVFKTNPTAETVLLKGSVVEIHIYTK